MEIEKMFQKVTNKYTLTYNLNIRKDVKIDESLNTIYINPKKDYYNSFVKTVYELSGKKRECNFDEETLDIVVDNFLKVKLFKQYLNNIIDMKVTNSKYNEY